MHIAIQRPPRKRFLSFSPLSLHRAAYHSLEFPPDSRPMHHEMAATILGRPAIGSALSVSFHISKTSLERCMSSALRPSINNQPRPTCFFTTVSRSLLTFLASLRRRSLLDSYPKLLGFVRQNCHDATLPEELLVRRELR